MAEARQQHDRSRGSGRRASLIEAAQRRRSVLALAAAGATYVDIAQQLGISNSTVGTIVKKALDEHRQSDLNVVERVRAQQLDRLDRLLVGVWQRASSGDLKAIDRVLKIEQARARLLGTEKAPGQVTEGGQHLHLHFADQAEIRRLEESYDAVSTAEDVPSDTIRTLPGVHNAEES